MSTLVGLMAEELPSVKLRADITECSLCSAGFIDPRVLPACIHTFCLSCSTQRTKNKCPGDVAACPLCRKTFRIPSAGLTALPKNAFVARLQTEKDLSSSVGKKSLPCDVCGHKKGLFSSVKIATSFCFECHESMCDGCREVHRKMKATVGHPTMRFDEKSFADELAAKSSASRRRCDKHEDHQLEVYCFDCGIALCKACCASDKHAEHTSSDVTRVAEYYRSRIARDMSELIKRVEKYRETLTTLDDRTSSFEQQFVEVEKQVYEHAEQLKRMVDDHRNKVLVS